MIPGQSLLQLLAGLSFCGHPVLMSLGRCLDPFSEIRVLGHVSLEPDVGVKRKTMVSILAIVFQV